MLYSRQIGDKSFTLYNGTNMFFVPRFKHLMLGHGLIDIWFPKDYYDTNNEALEMMSFNTNLYIKRLYDGEESNKRDAPL